MKYKEIYSYKFLRMNVIIFVLYENNEGEVRIIWENLKLFVNVIM